MTAWSPAENLYGSLAVYCVKRHGGSPDELAAVAAEGGLAQERGHELVAVDLVHAPPQRAAPPVEARALLELPPARRARAARCTQARSVQCGGMSDHALVHFVRDHPEFTIYPSTPYNPIENERATRA
ncbi:jg14259 [Pararge aegeria aegeria]|uniref:Jg14259 protein n=1 Tax=Pararge aegeria aegeria TaxID=348720 RepID=A0A8S4RHM6_9NEOP|nr:jg14259 [Pararge aegeria aegeria]